MEKKETWRRNGIYFEVIEWIDRSEFYDHDVFDCSTYNLRSRRDFVTSVTERFHRLSLVFFRVFLTNAVDPCRRYTFLRSSKKTIQYIDILTVFVHMIDHESPVKSEALCRWAQGDQASLNGGIGVRLLFRFVTHKWSLKTTRSQKIPQKKTKQRRCAFHAIRSFDGSSVSDDGHAVDGLEDDLAGRRKESSNSGRSREAEAPE